MKPARGLGQSLPQLVVDTALAPRMALTLLTGASALLLAAAWFFQLALGMLPCKLCLEQRWPHYLVILIGIGLLARLNLGSEIERASVQRSGTLRFGVGLLAMVFAVSAAMGTYHAGVEWGWFAGPSDCGSASPAAAGSMGDFLKQLQTTRVVSCTEAAWRFLGLSMAGWNGLISLGLAAFAATAVWKSQGSSSLSQ
ncbi:MAG: disulfide bond formation protein B [Bosea sp. (in: a-proteobacteria)]